MTEQEVTPVIEQEITPTAEQKEVAAELLELPCTSGYEQSQARILVPFWNGDSDPSAIKASATAVLSAE